MSPNPRYPRVRVEYPKGVYVLGNLITENETHYLIQLSGPTTEWFRKDLVDVINEPKFKVHDKFKPGDWAIDIINDCEVVVRRHVTASTYEVMRPFTADDVPYGLKVWHMRALNEPKFKVGDTVTAPGISKGHIIGNTSTHYLIKKFGESGRNAEWHRKDLVFALKDEPMKFKVGDKVRTIVGEVTRDQYDDGSVRVKWGNRELGCFDSHELELVERPKKEPKLGSVWYCGNSNNVHWQRKFIYIGGGRYYQANHPGVYTDRDLANDSDWEEVNDNA